MESQSDLPQATKPYASYEFSEWLIHLTSAEKMRVVVVYRPPYSGEHKVPTSVFLTSFLPTWSRSYYVKNGFLFVEILTSMSILSMILIQLNFVIYLNRLDCRNMSIRALTTTVTF